MLNTVQFVDTFRFQSEDALVEKSSISGKFLSRSNDSYPQGR